MLDLIPAGGHDEMKMMKSSTTKFEVSENTQCSVDMMTQIENHFTAVQAITDGQATGVTMVHDQHFTNLCHSFATMSGFRGVLLNLAKSVQNEFGANMVDCQEVIEEINKTGAFSFNHMLAVFLGCVSPRSYTSDSQSAETETIVSRLVSKTAFEIEGWKRILPVRKMFQKMNLNSQIFA